MIGDYLGTIEEFTAGDGTYAEDGKIYASKLGIKSIDIEKHVAEVKGKTIPKLSLGDVVFGEVVSLKQKMAIVVVSKIQGVEGTVDARTLLYVSNIADKFVENPKDMVAIGDIIKAKIIKMDDEVIDLSTKGEFGVVKAFCRRCRLPLNKSDKGEDKLECGGCGQIDARKIALDYGKVSDF